MKTVFFIVGNIKKRGEVGWSQIKLAERWKWSRTKTRKFLNDLEKEQQVRQQLSHSYSIIQIVNYEEYQENKTTGHTTGKQQQDTNNNNKEELRRKNKELILSKVDISTLDPSIKKYYQIAISFWELVKSNLKEVNISNSEIENAKFTTWVDPIRLLMEKDNRTIEEFREIFQFLQKNDFWKEQIRSTAKLRKKNKDGITYFEALLTISRNEQQRNERKKSSEREKQSGVSDNYRKSILARLHNL